MKMGFPVGYTDFLLPKLFIHALSLLGLLRAILHSLFPFLEPSTDTLLLDSPSFRQLDIPPLAALLIRELLPSTTFGDDDPSSCCAVCLYEFEAGDEIRRLMNCRHVFHRGCLDRWMDCHQMTCPLCRTRFVPDEMEEEFNQRLWAASGFTVAGDEAEFYCE